MNTRREGGQSLVIGGPSLVILGGKGVQSPVIPLSTGLFVHETFRVFGDRLNSLEDREWFRSNMDTTLQGIAESKWSALYPHGSDMTLFGNFMRDMDAPPYEEILDAAALKKKLEDALEEYNVESGGVPMNLVLFKDAAEHVCKIHRE